MGTAIRFTLRGCRWIPDNSEQNAEAVRQDSITDAIVFACEHRACVDPADFVGYMFGRVRGGPPLSPLSPAAAQRATGQRATAGDSGAAVDRCRLT